ncbi:MAG: hypothetical protein DME26_05335, partial [Verrucomicrobia bacterium]
MHWPGLFLRLAALSGGGLIFLQSARGQVSTNPFSFNDYLLAPVRVHLLSAKDSPAIQTTLTEKDITRIFGKMNGVWAQAGLHFYLESLVREEVNVQEVSPQPGEPTGRRWLLGLRPSQSKATNTFHIYYLKQMSVNGIYFPEAIFVKDTASLRKIEGGIDEPLPRVSSHELGHAFGLPHRQNTTNLMASGTTGMWLDEGEISRTREAARKFAWIERASDVMEKANAFFSANKIQEAATFYSRLATIPLRVDQVEMARQRFGLARRTDSSSTTK